MRDFWPLVSMLPRSFLNAFDVDILRFEAPLSCTLLGVLGRDRKGLLLFSRLFPLPLQCSRVPS